MTDETTDFENVDDILGLEKMPLARFKMTHTVRRPSQAPGKFDDLTTLQLPNNSVLHTLNGWDTLISPNHGMPDPTIPFVQNEKLPVWLRIHTALADEESRPFGIKDAYIYRPNRLMGAVSHFYQTHRKLHRILSDRTLGTLAGALTWLDYSPLNEVQVNGTLHGYRKFDLLFRTVLDSIVRIGPGKNHFVVFPQSDHLFSRASFLRTFKELSTGTLSGFVHDPAIFAIIHLLGYVYGQTKDLKVTPYKEDIRILGKDAEIFDELRSTSLLERLPEDILPSLNIVLQKDSQAVIYNLADLKEFAQDSSFFNKLFRHVMSLRLRGAHIPAHLDPDSDQFDTYVSTMAGDTTPVDEEDGDPPSVVKSTKSADVITPALPPVAAVKPEKIVPITSPEKFPESTVVAPITFEAAIRKASHAVGQSFGNRDPKETAKHQQLIDSHFSTSIAGKSLAELTHAEPTAKIVENKLDFVTSAPEASYRKSSLLAMDQTYQEQGFHHELAKVIGSTAKHGLFVTKIDEDKVHTEMDRTTTYKVHLTDEKGKSHHVKFTLPDVDDNGAMKLGGITYRLTRQIANVPICKISPTRVSLSSYYNKIRVERIQAKRNSYEQDINKLLLSLKAEGLVTAILGAAPPPTTAVAYDYSAVGRNFSEVTFNEFTFWFGGNHAPVKMGNSGDQDRIDKLTKTYGAWVGMGVDQSLLFWDLANQIHQIDRKNNEIRSWASFHHMLEEQLGAAASVDKTPVEWTQAEIINHTIPLIFILGFRYGISTILKRIGLDYRFYPTGQRAKLTTMDISVKFLDGTLVFNRYPLSRSLIAAGLNWVKLSDISFADLEYPDTYAKVFVKKDLSVGMLKGISGFFDFFVDPITQAILEKMGEPITFDGLLLRANLMLVDYAADDASAMKNHRFRLYERFNGFVYNEIYRALANYRNNPSSKKSFSINPEAVFQRIVQDSTMGPDDVINPVHEVKQRANVTFTGSGGRTANSIVQRDRIFPEDGLGVLSDAVPDSGKVGITAYLSASPNIDDIHGLPKPYKSGDPLEPPQILSIGSMVMPGGTTDDGKRNSYLSIQISHYVPNHGDGETLSVRTGYDEVLPHLSTDTFASAASADGVVEAIDAKHKVVRIRYADTHVPTIRTLKLPYLDTVLNQYRQDGTKFGFLIPDTELDKYPMGGVFALTKTTSGKILDRLRCDTADAIPDKDVARKQSQLVADLVRGKVQALYYIRFSAIDTFAPGPLKAYSFTSIHSPISGAYLLQTRTPNVSVGDKVKAGDIVTYNPGFFVPDPMSKQVTFKHGVLANVALIEKSSNHEDACEISRGLSERLKMTPCHQREIITRPDAALLTIVKIGDHVETTDSLCVISDAFLVGTSLSLDVENLDIMEKLSRQTPSAGYTGTIQKIRILYGCNRDKLSDSLLEVLKTYEKEVRDQFKALNPMGSAKAPDKPGWVAPGTHYKGVVFTDETVVLEFMIEETLDMVEGDKLVISNAAKSIVSHVAEKQHYTESGIPVDMLFSTTSIMGRIIASPLTVGMAERVMEELKRQVLDKYFGS